MIDEKTKYIVHYSSTFKKDYKKIKKQGKDITKLKKIVKKLANKEELEPKYKNHHLIKCKEFDDCYECHIEPDWLLVYKIFDNDLIFSFSKHGKS